MNLDEERYPAARAAVVHRRREGRGPARRTTSRRATSHAPHGRALRALRGAVPARRRGRLRRAAAAQLRAAARATRRCASTTGGASAHPGRRVPGHQRAAVPLAASCSPGRARAMFAVGDDDQSIYAFRGANVGNMQHFERDFHGRAASIKLEQNYRSHGNILDAANALIAQQRASASARTCGPSDGKGEPVRVYEAPTDLDEARVHRRGSARRCIATGMRARRRSRVLYRSQRAVARARARAVQRRACRTASTAACASSSAPRSSTRSPTCA